MIYKSMLPGVIRRLQLDDAASYAHTHIPRPMYSHVTKLLIQEQCPTRPDVKRLLEISIRNKGGCGNFCSIAHLKKWDRCRAGCDCICTQMCDGEIEILKAPSWTREYTACVSFPKQQLDGDNSICFSLKNLQQIHKPAQNHHPAPKSAPAPAGPYALAW